MNNVVVIGRLTKDPELRYIPGSETPVANFILAIDRDYKNKDGTTTVDFIPVELMGKPAEFCANYITKGRLVGVQGSIRVDRYETPNGEKKTFTKVAGRNIQALESRKQAEGSKINNEETSNEFETIYDDDVPF